MSSVQIFIISIIFALMWANLTKKVALRKGLSPHFFYLGLLTGFLGFLIVLLLPKKVTPPQKKAPPVVVSSFEQQHWFYIDKDKKQIGPIPFQDLKKAWKENQIHIKNYIWTEDFSDWKKIDDLKELKKELIEK